MGGEGIVYNPVDWRHATTAELEGQRVIARFDNGTVVDGTIIIAVFRQINLRVVTS